MYCLNGELETSSSVLVFGLILGKINLKIYWSVKTLWHEYSAVARSELWAHGVHKVLPVDSEIAQDHIWKCHFPWMYRAQLVSISLPRMKAFFGLVMRSSHTLRAQRKSAWEARFP